MLNCWGDTAKARPSFSELCEQLDEILSTEAAQVWFLNKTKYTKTSAGQLESFQLCLDIKNLSLFEISPVMLEY